MTVSSCKITSLVVLILFAVLVGHIASRAYFPAYSHKDSISGKFQPMRARPESAHRKTLYFRRTWHVSQLPSNAWLKVIGHDEIEVFVNNRQVGRQNAGHAKANASLAANITHLLQTGENCIAICVWQKSFGSPPEIAVEAGYQLQNGEQRSLGDANDWRYSHTHERRFSIWYAPDFDDAHWQRPAFGDTVHWHAPCVIPPELVSNEFRSPWIRPQEMISGSASLRRTFDLDGIPQKGWLRLIATAPYRLAINGKEVADDTLWVPTVYDSKQIAYDIGPLLRSGRNTVAIEINTTGYVPHVSAELTASNSSGQQTHIQTDERWLSLGGRVHDWLAEDIETSLWVPSVVEKSNVGVQASRIPLQYRSITLPAKQLGNLLGFQLLATVLLGFFGGVGSFTTGKLLNRIGNRQAAWASRVPLLALVPSILIASLEILASWDSAIGGASPYRWSNLLWLGALPVLQWVAMLLFATLSTENTPVPKEETDCSKRVSTVLFVVIGFVALWLRVADLYREPIHHDENGVYQWTMGTWERGFPSIDIHPDLPMGYSATSELVYFMNAPMALFSDDARTIVRVPAMIWSMATLVLIYFGTRRLLGYQVALITSVVFAISPYFVVMSTFGRYFAQLQFFTMLSIFAFWEIIRKPGPINRRALWLTVFAFCCMYLSWEGSALIALGMALAALFYRRNELKTIFLSPSIYASMATIGLVVAAQNAHRLTIQSQRLISGAGIDLMSMTPMWKNQFFRPDYYFKGISWLADSLLPLFVLALALGIALIAHRTHRWLSVFLTIGLTPALLMTLFLPLRSIRYSYHLTPVFVLIFAYVLVQAAAALSRLSHADSVPGWVSIYSRSVTTLLLVAITLLFSGQLIQTDRLTSWAIWVHRANELKFPDWSGSFQYVREHFQEGDIVISIYPHLTDERLGRRSDYWLQTTMKRQVTFDDRRSAALDRGAGTPVVINREHLEQIFNQNKRIWYCTIPFVHNDLNDRDVSEYLGQHMDVVYEDYKTSILLHDSINRPAETHNKIRQTRAYLQ